MNKKRKVITYLCPKADGLKIDMIDYDSFTPTHTAAVGDAGLYGVHESELCIITSPNDIGLTHDLEVGELVVSVWAQDEKSYAYLTLKGGKPHFTVCYAGRSQERNAHAVQEHFRYSVIAYYDAVGDECHVYIIGYDYADNGAMMVTVYDYIVDDVDGDCTISTQLFNDQLLEDDLLYPIVIAEKRHPNDGEEKDSALDEVYGTDGNCKSAYDNFRDLWEKVSKSE